MESLSLELNLPRKMGKGLRMRLTVSPNRVHILMEAEDGRFHYTGIGRFCDTWEEAVDFARYYGCIKIEKVNY